MAAVGILAASGLAAAQSGPTDGATFTRDIAPILQRSCERCHRSSEPLRLAALADDDGIPESKSARSLWPGLATPIRDNAWGLRVAWLVYRGPGDQVATTAASSPPPT